MSDLNDPLAVSLFSEIFMIDQLARAQLTKALPMGMELSHFVLAPAQTGSHSITQGKPRDTWGHSMAISPWGEVLADGGIEPGVTIVDLDLSQVETSRARLPSLSHDRLYEGP